jgi:serine/threonine-protein kinase
MDDKNPVDDVPTVSIVGRGLLLNLSNTDDSPSGSKLESSPSSPSNESRPAAIPGYEIMGEVGRGGMGIVYKAWQPKAKRFVAVKMMSEKSVENETRRKRFLAEAETLASLSHPNIIALYEAGEIDDVPFFTFEYCSGGSLAKKIAGNPIAPAQAAAIAEKLARAVATAHKQNIVHRDLKPANILLTPEGEPKITDFGVAKHLDRDEGMTRAGSILGTPNYMPPEQAFENSKSLTPQADVYALGAILYEMLTGRPPFKGVTAMETIEQLRFQQVVPPRMLVGRIPEDLQTICLRCLRKDKTQRYPSAAELVADLQRYLAYQPIEARPEVQRSTRRKWLIRIGIGVLGATYVVALVGAAKHWFG